MRRDALFSALAVFWRCVEVVDRLGVFEREAVGDLLGAGGGFFVEGVVMRRATFLIRSAEPTEVPPNFNTFMWVMFLGGDDVC